jgi:hypothetical protein
MKHAAKSTIEVETAVSARWLIGVTRATRYRYLTVDDV